MRQNSNILEEAQIYENKSTALRRDEVIRGWRKLHKQERRIPDIFLKIK
jgi:hypothetical protein